MVHFLQRSRIGARIRRAEWAGVFAVYALAACVALWALVVQMGAAVPYGHSTDYYQFHWNYWWMRHALQHGVSPLWSDYVLYPHTHNLSLHTLAPVWLPLYMGVEPVLGRAAAVNAMVLLSFPLTGTAMYAWLRRVLGRGWAQRGAAFLGGLLLAFSPYMLDHAANTHINLTTLWWFPLTLLLWDEVAFMRAWPRPLSAALLGLALWGAALSDLQYALWLPWTLGLYGLWSLWSLRRGRAWAAPVAWGAAALGLALALVWVWPGAALAQVDTLSPDFPPAGMHTIRTYALPLAALVGLAEPVQDRTLGRVPVGLVWSGVVAAVWQRGSSNKKAWFWLLAALGPLVLALGPDAGEVTLPYLYLHDMLNGQYRNPVRFGQPALFNLLTFAALVWAPLLARCGRRLGVALAAGVGVLALVDAGALAPFPVWVPPDYAIHHEVAQEGGDFVIMDVPVGTHYGWTGMGSGQYSMYYGPAHGHRMVNGTLSRMPYSDLRYYLESPLFSWLAGARPLEAGDAAAVAAEFDTYLHEWPVGYVFAYRGWMDGARQEEWIGWLNTRPGLCMAQATPEADLLWWRAEALGCAPGVTGRVALGAPASWQHVGPGWFGPEAIGGPAGRWAGERAVLRVALAPGAAYEVTFSALAFGAGRTVRVAGGEPLALAEVWREYTVRVRPLPDGLLTLVHDGTESPAALLGSEDERQLAAAYAEFVFRLAAE